MRKVAGLILFLLVVVGTAAGQTSVDQRQDLGIAHAIQTNDRQELAIAQAIQTDDKQDAELKRVKTGYAHDSQARRAGNRAIEGVIMLRFLTPEGKYPTPEQVDPIVDKLVVRDMRSKAFWPNVRALVPDDWKWIDKPAVGVTAEQFAEYRKATDAKIAQLERDLAQTVAVATRATTQNKMELNAFYGAVVHHTETRKSPSGDSVLIRVPDGQLVNEQFVAGAVASSEQSMREEMKQNLAAMQQLVTDGEDYTKTQQALLGFLHVLTSDNDKAYKEGIRIMDDVFGKGWLNELDDSPTTTATASD